MRRYFFRAPVHPVPLPRHIVVEVLWHNCFDAMHRRCVGSSDAEDPASKSPLLASTWPSDRPTLLPYQGVGSSGVEGFVLACLFLIQTECRIDRRCPHSDRRIIWCYCLPYSSSTTRPTLLNNGPSVHPTVPRVWPCVPTRPTIAATLVKLIPSVHLTLSFLFLFLLGFDPLFWHFCMWFSCILGT
jgi:hypothetical protein